MLTSPSYKWAGLKSSLQASQGMSSHKRLAVYCFWPKNQFVQFYLSLVVSGAKYQILNFTGARIPIEKPSGPPIGN